MMHGQQGYHPSSFIRHVRAGGRVVILDLRSEAYLAFDPTASAFWEQLLLPLSRDERLAGLLDKFHIEPDRIAADLDAFTHKCIDDGLLTEGGEEVDAIGPAKVSAAGQAVRDFLPCRAWWRLLQVSRALKRRGFASTYQATMECAGCAEFAGAGQDEWLRQAVAAFAHAENFCYLKKAPLDCLPRSLALFEFLRRVGLQAVHCIGVRQFPFGAHAWVEFQGKVVHDNPAVAKTYAVIARIPHEPVPGET